MNVYYRPYKLTNKRHLNRHDSTRIKSGVHLKIKRRFTEHFADYFPHETLGDKPVELFLEGFKYQENEYEQKIFHFLLNEEKIRSIKPAPYLDHGVSNTIVLKYKIMAEDDLGFIPLLEKNIKVRLDANALFNQSTLKKFLSQIPSELLKNIEYLEDPMSETDWNGIPVPLAQDFTQGTPSDFLIHKPNCRFLKPTDKKVIFSSYMGSDLGRFHTYCELMEKGDRKLYHGIQTPDLYQEQRLEDFTNTKQVLNLYNDLSSGEWKLLCSI